MLSRLLFLTAVMLLVALSTSAQTQSLIEESANEISTALLDSEDSPYQLQKGMNEFGIWGGGALRATTIFGGLRREEAAGRRYLIAGLRYGRVLASSKRVALEYTLDVIPIAVAFNNITAETPTGFIRENVYGAGLAPLGLKASFGRGSIKPYAGVSGGGLVFREPVPLPDAGRFAFNGDAEGGVHVFTRPGRAVILGIKFHHISNGDRMGANRGLNQFVFFGGFSVFR